MAVELLGAKLVAPYYGTSLYMWSAVLACTLGGLALGYLAGGSLSHKYPGEKILYLLIALAGVFTLLLPYTGDLVMGLTMFLPLKAGITVSALLLMTPPVFLFGTVSPVIIGLLSEKPERAMKVSGTVYGVSTLGGVCATFLTAFYLAPFAGLRMSSLLVAGSLLIWPLLFAARRAIRK